jgi:hypothetical protein
MNVTVTEPDAAGYLTLWPSGAAMPTASNLNFVAGQTVPNLVVVPVGAGGRVSILNFGGRAHVVADVLGWYAGGVDSRPTAASLTELLDQVDGAGFSERTTQVQGQARFNSLTGLGGFCSASTPAWSEYNLGRQWGTLSTTFSFDDINSTATSRMRFRILGDGVALVERTLSFGQSADVTANVTGVLRVRFEVLNGNVAGSPCSYYPTFATPQLAR